MQTGTENREKNLFQTEKAAYFKRVFSRLNDCQRQAVFSTNGPVLVLAGAGSGKTTVLVERVRNLLTYGDSTDTKEPPAAADAILPLLQRANKGEQLTAQEQDTLRLSMRHQPVPPYRILAITFTNKAARELKERICAKVGTEGERIWACTFHSACLRMLRGNVTLLGYPSAFTIYDTDDQAKLMKKLLAEENVDEKIFPPKQMVSKIGRLKDRLTSPEEFAAKHPNTYENHILARLYLRYQDRLKKAGAMDFDDIIGQTVRLFSEHPEVLERYQNQFTHIMVDEYQDTNPAQFELVRLLAKKSRNLCVVGDDDQSIYRFRGATIENILSFEEQYPDCRTVRLEENYRSTPEILAAANKIIANNHNRKGKTLWTARAEKEKVKLVAVDNDISEGRFIGGIIKKDVAAGANYHDHAILYRMNAQSNSIERTLTSMRIPYQVFGGQPFLGRKEIKDVRAYLCLILNPHDDERLLRVLNEPKRSIGASTIQKLQELANQYECSLFTILERADTFSVFSTKTAECLLRFAAMIRALQESEKKETLAELYDEMLEKTGYTMALMAQGEEGQNRLENVNEFRSNIADFMLKEEKTPDLYEEFPAEEQPETTQLERFLAETELSTDQDRADENEDKVTLMTIHSAKGLEFPVVFLPGMEENIFPSGRSQESEDDVEEERRLAYVAVTRAKDRLYLVKAGQRMLFGRTMFNPLSRYAEEMGKEELELLCPDRRPANTPGNNGRSGEYSFAGGRQTGMDTGGFAAAPAARRTPRLGGGLSGGAGGGIPGRGSLGGGIPGRTTNAAGKSKPIPAFKAGMRIVHPRFGDGEILSVSAMGGDQLVEIAFDRAGTKKIMARLANMTVREDGD